MKKPTLKDFRNLETRVKNAEAKAVALEEEKKKGFLGGEAPNIYTPTRGMASTENKALMLFGAMNSGAKGLLKVNVSAPQFKHVPMEVKQYVYQLKQDFIINKFISQMFYDRNWDHVGTNEKYDKRGSTPSFMDTYYYKNILGPKLKAFTISADPGQQWVPTATASTYINEIEVARAIVAMLRQVNMPTSPYEMPTIGYSVARRASEKVALTEGTYEMEKLTLTSKKYGQFFCFSEELREDSAPDAIRSGQLELEEAHLRAFETSLLNGTEIGTTHIDSDTEAGAADLAEKQFHGLRYYAIQNSANGSLVDFLNATGDDGKFLSMRQRMGKAGQDPTNLVYIPSPSVYLQMVATEQVIQADRAGSLASWGSGVLGKYHGSDVVPSGFMREDLNATGQYDGATTDRASCLLINKDRWYWGTRRPITLALRPSRSQEDIIEMASYSRVDFIGHPQGASNVQGEELTVVYGHNIALS